MSPSLPVVSSDQVVKAFAKVGFQVLPSRGKGSHVVMHKAGWPAILCIPRRREMRRGTLRSLIRDAGLTVEQFTSFL